MKVCIHRGAKEIGGSFVGLESNNQRLILGIGLPPDADKKDIQYLTEISGTDGEEPSLFGGLISPPPVDHFWL
ncbi:MAG: MBL fold metallo-hydrolase, partial [FCB group bacterium]|nr:MBL fold metallo-hydrolase [FCB group bacterium]